MKRVMVRYKVKPEAVAENERLVRAVYDELQKTQPSGMRYATFKLDDGVSFVHLHSRGGDNAVTQLASFKAFQQELADRCDETPTSSEVTEIGSYRLNTET